LCKLAAEGTTVNAVEMEAAAQMLVSRILKELGDGNNVNIKDLGTFSVSAGNTDSA
jgi:nucleoid DNA-binding protein